MARLVAEIDDNLYKKFKIIAMKEDKTIKDKITELIEEAYFDKLYEIKHIDMSQIYEILRESGFVQINLINGHMIGYSEKRDPLVDEEKLCLVSSSDLESCKGNNYDFGSWICDLLNEGDFARVNFVKFVPN